MPDFMLNGFNEVTDKKSLPGHLAMPHTFDSTLVQLTAFAGQLLWRLLMPLPQVTGHLLQSDHIPLVKLTGTVDEISKEK